MELSLVLVLTLVTLGTATPHGYGVKGGASAKAEASAIAGGLGDLGPIPHSIPSGAAYTGSFSKSSSSSFASSSASSSSSSYSFSGSGANGIAGNNVDGLGHKGCSSGVCPGTGAFVPLNGAQQIGSANAGAAAQAKAFSGVSGIVGNDADGSNHKGCSSGTCPEVGANGAILNGVQQSGSTNADAAAQANALSGVNGITVNGADESNHKGCTSGTCTGADVTGPSSNGAHPLSSANADAAAQAKALSGSYTPCQGSECQDSLPKKCISGHCQPKTEPETLSNGNGFSSDCSSGQCDKDKQGVDNESNDFAVNINRNTQLKPSYGPSGQYSNKEKPYSSGSDCFNGKCGPINSYPNNAASSQFKPPAPATYLTTPNQNSPCTTANCNYPTQGYGAETGALPSSYNVPIQSATNPPNTYSPPGSVQNGVPCTSPSCNSPSYNVGTSNIPKNNYGQKPGNQGSCVSGQCDINSASNLKPSSNGAESPNYSLSPYPTNIPSAHLGQPGCSSPNCAVLPSNQPNVGIPTQTKYTIPSYSNGPDSSCGGAGCSGSPHTGLPTKPSKPDAPVYTGGFGGPAGVLNTASGYNKLPGHSSPTHTPGIKEPAGGFGPTYVPGSFGTTKPNELSPASHYTPTHTPSVSGSIGAFGSTPTHGYFGTTKPNDVNSVNHYNPTLHPSTGNSGAYGSTPIHGSFAPTLTPSTGGPTGDFGYNKPNSLPSTPSTQYSSSFVTPTSSSGTSPGAVTHTDHTNLDKPSSPFNTGSSPGHTGGIEGSTGISYVNSGANSIHGSFGLTKPSTASNAQTSPNYTGGFGAPTGSIEAPSSTFGSINPLKPGSSDCGLADCSGQSNANVNAGTVSHANKNPVTATSSQKKPAYTGGFGGPTGFLKPNDFSIPTNTATSSLGNTPCASGNCDSKSAPSPSYSHGNLLTGAQSLAAAAASANAVAYSGGFGGPPGVFKPFDDGKAHNTANGNLGSEVHSPAHGNLGSGAHKPAHGTLGSEAHSPSHGNFGSEAHNPAHGYHGIEVHSPAHGNLGNEAHSPAHGNLGSNAHIPAHGGLGIEAHGLAHANLGSDVHNPAQGNLASGQSPTFNAAHSVIPSASGKDTVLENSASGANAGAHASASATASAGSYSGSNNHQHSNGSSGGCNSGCGSNHGSNANGANFGFSDGFLKNGAGASSVASAKSIAGANSFGYGGSFASSSASAHASAAAGVKGGYGRK